MAKQKTKQAAAPSRLGAGLFDSHPLAPTAPEEPAPAAPRRAAPPPVAAPPAEPATPSMEESDERPGDDEVLAPRPAGRRLTKTAELGPPGYVAGGRRPAPDLLDVAPVRLTTYLAPEQVQRLRAEVLKRQAKGRRSDISTLIREAIDLIYPPKGKP